MMKGKKMNEEKHILTMLVDNQPGVLSRVVGLFSGRGYNIESLCVAPTIDPLVSRITLVTKTNLPALAITAAGIEAETVIPALRPT